MSLYTNLGENGSREHSVLTASTSGVSFARSPRLVAVEFYNNSATPFFVHHEDDASDATSMGRPVTEGLSWVDSASDGPWYLFTSSGTAEVRVTAVYRRV